MKKFMILIFLVSSIFAIDPVITITNPTDDFVATIGDTIWVDWDYSDLPLNQVIVSITYDGWLSDEWLSQDGGLPESDDYWQNFPVVPTDTSSQFAIRVSLYTNMNWAYDIVGPLTVVDPNSRIKSLKRNQLSTLITNIYKKGDFKSKLVAPNGRIIAHLSNISSNDLKSYDNNKFGNGQYFHHLKVENNTYSRALMIME